MDFTCPVVAVKKAENKANESLQKENRKAESLRF